MGRKAFFQNFIPAKILIYSTKNCYNFLANNYILLQNYFLCNLKTEGLLSSHLSNAGGGFVSPGHDCVLPPA